MKASAQGHKLMMQRVFGENRIRPRAPSRRSQRRGTLHRLVSQLTSGGLWLQVSGPEVEQCVVVRGLRVVVLLDYGEDVEGNLAGERQGKLIKRRQVGQEMRRHDRVAEQKQRVIVRVVLVIVRRRVGAAGPRGTARGSLTLNPAPHRSFGVAAAPGGGACPSCVAVLRQRLRHDASDLPSEQQRSRWEQRLRHAARTVRGFEPGQAHSVTRQGQQQKPRSRSGGRRKPNDQAGPRESS